VRGRDAATPSEVYRGVETNYKGTMFPGLANLFVLGGPRTALSYPSIIFMLESQLNYATKAVRTALNENVLIEPKPHIAAQWTRELQTKLPSTVSSTECSRWYLNDAGVNTAIWPDFMFKFEVITRDFDERDHLMVSSKGRPISPN
jgi:hypothetical protein